MTYLPKKQQVAHYELSIEPIAFVSIMSRYSHNLKVRYDGLAIDPGRVLYLSLSKELGVTDLTGNLMWYRGGATYCHVNGALVCTSISFSFWVLQMMHQYHVYLSHQDSKRPMNFTWSVMPSSGSA
jgi:hypothetical protein